MEGNDLSGLIEAEDTRAAANSLREQGLFTLHLVPAAAARPATVIQPDGTGLNTPIRPVLQPDGMNYDRSPIGTQSKVYVAPFLLSVALPELAMMYRQMATLFDAGVPMVQAITTLSQQTRHERLKKILQDGASTVASGHPFSDVMQRYPAVFTPNTDRTDPCGGGGRHAGDHV